MTADVIRRTSVLEDLAREASTRSERATKNKTAERAFLEELVHNFDQQPRAWQPEQFIARVRIFLATS